jgi:4-hydroxy-tetrahydrodipicolinate synthase
MPVTNKGMKLTTDARGVYPIAPTPFLDDGTIDTASIDRLVDFYLGCGSQGITVLGQLGEAPKLEHAESVDVATRMIRRAAALPVIVGVSAPGFAAMRALAREVMDRGAAGVMIAPPRHCAPTTRSSATTARRSKPSATTCPSWSRTIR